MFEDECAVFNRLIVGKFSSRSCFFFIRWHNQRERCYFLTRIFFVRNNVIVISWCTDIVTFVDHDKKKCRHVIECWCSHERCSFAYEMTTVHCRSSYLIKTRNVTRSLIDQTILFFTCSTDILMHDHYIYIDHRQRNQRSKMKIVVCSSTLKEQF